MFFHSPFVIQRFVIRRFVIRRFVRVSRALLTQWCSTTFCRWILGPQFFTGGDWAPSFLQVAIRPLGYQAFCWLLYEAPSFSQVDMGPPWTQLFTVGYHDSSLLLVDKRIILQLAIMTLSFSGGLDKRSILQVAIGQ